MRGALLAVLLVCGCNVCERFDQRLESRCGLVDTAADDGEPAVCPNGSPEECVAKCGLKAPCSVFDGSLNTSDPADQEVAAEYGDCIVDCFR